MKPYYQHAGITIYHGDCREIEPTLRGGDGGQLCDLLITDPPYGISDRTKRASAGRGKTIKKGLHGTPKWLDSRDWQEIEGDNEFFDPSRWLSYHKVVLFGANHYASLLPPSSRWLVWDKREGTTSDDNADCELAWANVKGPARLYTQLWRGVCKRGEENHANGLGLQHPHQKPVALMQWVIRQCYVTGYELLLDPYMGSGSTILAAKRMNIAAIGIEIKEEYCEIASKRLSQEVLQFEVSE